MRDFDFDKVIDRRGTGSYKWDSAADGVIPMWVADMDFATAPCIMDALRQRVEHGVFGYVKVPQEYYEAVTNWFDTRHNWQIDPAHIIYTSGVVPALSAIIKAVTRPGDKVIVQTPAYNCFFSSIRNNECVLFENPLTYSPEGYTIDFDNLEQVAADPKATVMILCNPHNPAGRVWTRDELLRIADICHRHGVFVISDEIHCELTFGEHHYIPFASLNHKAVKYSASCISPSKAFNIAGLQIANIVAQNDEIRRKIDKAININEVCDVNPFGVVATIAAYNEGEPWLTALKAYLWQNYTTLCEFFSEKLPQYPITPLQGTYLAWINCSVTGMNGDEVEKLLESEAGVMLNAGSMYGSEGRDFLRVNLACPRATLMEALRRIEPVLKRLVD